MDNNSELKSLNKLFQEKIFRIPDYQRGYSWESEQLEEFIDDIMTLNEKQIHYMGMLSLKELTDEEKDKLEDEKWLIRSDEIKPYYVIDGQQRLTTCFILVDTIIDFLENIENKENKKILIQSKTLKEIREHYIYRDDPEQEEIKVRAYKILYDKDEESNEYLKDVIIAGKNDIDKTKTLYTNNLLKAKKTFNIWLEELYNEENKNLEAIKLVYKKVTQLLKFNIYYIDENSNVNISFETMNNRGKPLSNLELLKNRLLYLATLFDNGKNRSSINVVKKDINNAWSTIYKKLGESPKIKLNDDDYLRLHWIIYFPYSRSKIKGRTIVYDYFLLNLYFTHKRFLEKTVKVSKDENPIKEINDEEEIEDIEEIENEIYSDSSLMDMINKEIKLADIERYVKSLEELIPFWYQSILPQERKGLNEDLKKWLIKINRLKVAHVRPLVTVVLSLYNEENHNEVIEFLKKLEKYIFLNFAIGKHASNYKDSRFYKLARDLKEGNISISDIINEISYIEELDDNGILRIDNEALPKFNKLFDNNQGFYSTHWKNYLKYFLYEYEFNLKEDPGANSIDPDDLFESDKDTVSIEHIYPETEDGEWEKIFEKYSEREKKSLLHTLGNLLPLSKRINSSLQNKSYEEKKKMRYKKGSQSELEISNNYDVWNAEAIKKRGLNLLKFMETRWDFKFKDEADKYKILNLEFLLKEDIENDKEKNYVSDYEFKFKQRSENKKEKNNDITEKEISTVYEYGKIVHSGKMKYAAALKDIIKQTDMKKNSADVYLTAIISMLNGEIFKFGISNFAVEYLLAKIFEEYDDNIKRNALKSIKQHLNLPNRSGHKGKMKIYEKYLNKMK